MIAPNREHFMKIFAIASLFLFCVLPVQAQSVKSRPLTAPVHKTVAYFAQEVSATGYVNATLRVGPLASSSVGFGVEKLTTKTEFPVVAPASLVLNNPTTQNAALAAAGNWVKNEIPSFKQRAGAWLDQSGLGTGVYTFNQEVMIATTTGVKKKAVAFSMTVDKNGRALYGSPKIVDSDPTIIEAIYAPLRALEGLPAGWKYPDAGKIKWRVLNKKYEPLTDWQFVETNGAFDENTAGEVEDPANGQVRCLMDLGYPGCSGPKDIRTIMADTGSSFAIVDYVRKMEPDYAPAGDGESFVAKAAISVDERVWDCTNYKNKGYYGLVLNMRSERYTAQSSVELTPFSLVQEFNMKTLSPTEAYDKSVPVSQVTGNPADYVIAPYPEDNSLWSTANAELMKNFVYIAPVVAKGSDGKLTGTSFAGDMRVEEISSTGGNTREYYIGTLGDNYWGSGNYDRNVYFNVQSPQELEEIAITQQGFDDWLMIAINGQVLYIGPYGGNMLEPTGLGVAESNCTGSAGAYSCTSQMPRTFGDATPPSGHGTCTPASNLEGDYWNCVRSYGYCSSLYGDGGYTCSDSPCPANSVQYLSNSAKWGDGCRARELATSWNTSKYLDLKPYLQNGQNHVFMRVIVQGAGEGWFKLRTKTCGAAFNLENKEPPVPPAGASKAGVETSLANQM